MSQFYSSSIVASLLSANVKKIDTLKKLAKSEIDVGVEDLNNLRFIINVRLNQLI